MPNHLANEPSLYLKLHASDPVDWWPWCDEAFAQARQRDVPVFLSIGFSSCHWCHVMQRESFSNPEIGSLLNERFVAIKVDREERPDVDGLYLQALIDMGYEAGWPASLWLDHDGVPFSGGTYFPRYPQYGTQAFPDVLKHLSEAWGNNRPALLKRSQDLLAQLAAAPQAGELPDDAWQRALAGLLDGWNRDAAGWGAGIRFPMPPNMELMLDDVARNASSRAEEPLRQLLGAIDRGGLHDHLGGGFHRYTVDEQWTVPHFEKMLSDNAQLVRIFARAASVLGNPRYARVARDTVGWLESTLLDEGTFRSSQDADSEGLEGEHYVWTRDQVRRVLGAAAPAFERAYGVRAHGNFEGRTVLNRARGHDPESPGLKASRQALLAERQRRPRPRVDDGRVVANNALMVGALAEAGALLGEAQWIELAASCAQALLDARKPDGSLPRTLAPGAPDGVLEDHAWLADALLDLHEAGGDEAWLAAAIDLARVIDQRFAGDSPGDLLASAEALLPARQRPIDDGALPSAVGVALRVRQRLAAVGAVPEQAALDGLALHASALVEQPAGHATLVGVLERTRRPKSLVAIRAPPGRASPLLAAVHARYRPDAQVVVAGEGTTLPVFEGREATEPTAWVCTGQTCSLPTSEPEALGRLLDERQAPQRTTRPELAPAQPQRRSVAEEVPTAPRVRKRDRITGLARRLLGREPR